MAALSPGGGKQWPPVRLVAGVAVGLVVASLAWSLARWMVFALRCPYELDYGEGIILNTALQIAGGHPIYNDYHHYPFIVATYPPVYPLLCALGAKLWGVSFAFGRAVSMLSTLAGGLFIWLLLRRAQLSRPAAGFAAVLFVGAPAVAQRGAFMRIDMLAVALGLAGLYCVVRGGRRRLLWAVALFAAAFYTRQSEVAPLAAGVVYLWFAGRRRQALGLAGGWLAATAALYLALQVSSGGGFYDHVIASNMNYWSAGILRDIWVLTYVTWRWPFLFAAVGLLLWLAKPGSDRPAYHPAWLLVWYLLFAVLVTVTAGKVGSYVNYTLEAIAAAALLSGVAYQRLAELLAHRSRVAWAAAWLLLVAPPALLLAQPGRQAWQPMPYFDPQGMVAAGERFAPILRGTVGEVLSEDIGLLLLTGHRVLLDPHKMTSMARDGRWNAAPLIRDIKRRRFAYIITTWDPATAPLDRWGTYGTYRWTKGAGDAIKGSYRPVEHVGTLYLLAPAGDPGSVSRPSGSSIPR